MNKKWEESRIIKKELEKALKKKEKFIEIQ